jgi:glycosyltransferase
MKFSIITPSYNSAATIADTIASVARQTYQNREHIIIDGLSIDRTLAVVAEWQARWPLRLIAEPDAGLYDAMNKGIRLATGDIVGILNSDDFYYNDEVLAKVAAVFANQPDIAAVYGDLVYVSPRDTRRLVRYWRSGKYRPEKINWGWTIPHPALFVRRSVYEDSGKIFDLSFSLAADYELILRLLKIKKIRVAYLPAVLVKMRVGGASNRSIRQHWRGWQELRRAWRVNNLPVPRFFIIRRVLSKLPQLFRKFKFD